MAKDSSGFHSNLMLCCVYFEILLSTNIIIYNIFRFPEELNGHHCYNAFFLGVLQKSGYSLIWSHMTAKVVAIIINPFTPPLFTFPNNWNCECSCAFVIGNLNNKEDDDKPDNAILAKSLNTFTQTTLA